MGASLNKRISRHVTELPLMARDYRNSPTQHNPTTTRRGKIWQIWPSDSTEVGSIDTFTCRHHPGFFVYIENSLKGNNTIKIPSYNQGLRQRPNFGAENVQNVQIIQSARRYKWATSKNPD